MIHSMTAFASVSENGDFGQLSWEIRSVNHRFLDINIKLPENLGMFEPELRERVRETLKRGKVDCYLKQFVLKQGETLALNQSLLSQLVHKARDIKQKFSEDANADISVDVIHLLNWPGVLIPAETNLKEIKGIILTAFNHAIADLITARAREGEALEKVLLAKLKNIDAEAKKVKKRLPDILKLQHEKLQSRLSDAKIELDPNRLEQEMVMFANKIDITEELDRLNTHVSEVKRIIEKGGAIGRRLDFFMQELNREANTMASKSVDAATTQVAVAIKVLIEQMREQVQNIE